MSRDPREDTRETTGRRKRVPLGVPRMKLSHKPIAGHVTRWVADRPGRLQAAEEGGYEFVTEKDMSDFGEDGGTRATQPDSRIQRISGTHPDGKPMKLYLMKIKQEWYDEDQKAKADKIAESEREIFRGKEKRDTTADKDGMYIPGGSHISSKTYQKQSSSEV